MLKAKIQVNSMTIEVEGTTREVASLIRDLHANPPFKVNEDGSATNIEIKTSGEAKGMPTAEEVAKHIDGLPHREHTLEDIMAHFLGEPLPSRRDDGTSNPEYLRFAHRVKRARELLGKSGVKFQHRKEGRQNIYKSP